MINYCDCCKKNKTVHTYKLPAIGFGSFFDCVHESDKFEFVLCDECATEINRWIKKKYPEINLGRFWACNIIHPDDCEYINRFEYEEELFSVFDKFTPQLLYGNEFTKLYSFFYKAQGLYYTLKDYIIALWHNIARIMHKRKE